MIKILTISFSILLICIKSIALENKILFKIDSEIITTADINNEANYLKILNKNMNSFEQNQIFEITKNSLTSSYDVYNGQINRIISASGNDDDQYQAMLTSSSDTKFDGTQYCYPEIIRSGSSWLTVTSSRYCEAVTPYISSSRVSEIYQLLYSETPASSTSAALCHRPWRHRPPVPFRTARLPGARP